MQSESATASTYTPARDTVFDTTAIWGLLSEQTQELTVEATALLLEQLALEIQIELQSLYEDISFVAEEDTPVDLPSGPVGTPENPDNLAWDTVTVSPEDLLL